MESEQDKQTSSEPQSQGGARGGQGGSVGAAQPSPAASRRRVFIGLGVGAVVIVGAALAMQRTPGSPSLSGEVAADITLLTSDSADVDCSAAKGVEPYHCGFTDENLAWKGDEQHKLKPFYTTDRHLYLIPGLFSQPALQERYKAEPADKPRDQLKRFTAKCTLKIVGKVGGVRVRWLTSGAWSNPDEVEVATPSNCKVEG